MRMWFNSLKSSRTLRLIADYPSVVWIHCGRSHGKSANWRRRAVAREPFCDACEWMLVCIGQDGHAGFWYVTGGILRRCAQWSIANNGVDSRLNNWSMVYSEVDVMFVLSSCFTHVLGGFESYRLHAYFDQYEHRLRWNFVEHIRWDGDCYNHKWWAEWGLTQQKVVREYVGASVYLRVLCVYQMSNLNTSILTIIRNITAKSCDNGGLNYLYCSVVLGW